MNVDVQADRRGETFNTTKCSAGQVGYFQRCDQTWMGSSPQKTPFLYVAEICENKHNKIEKFTSITETMIVIHSTKCKWCKFLNWDWNSYIIHICIYIFILTNIWICQYMSKTESQWTINNCPEARTRHRTTNIVWRMAQVQKLTRSACSSLEAFIFNKQISITYTHTHTQQKHFYIHRKCYYNPQNNYKHTSSYIFIYIYTYTF